MRIRIAWRRSRGSRQGRMRNFLVDIAEARTSIFSYFRLIVLIASSVQFASNVE